METSLENMKEGKILSREYIIGPKRGSNRAQKFRRFLGFFLFFNGILMPFWGFNYSKMAKYRFLIDSNTFWMDFGTSKILRFFGPVVDP